MTEGSGEGEAEGPSVGVRWPEIIVSGLLAAMALLVIYGSHDAGLGWSDDGPRSGYFPFYIGLVLLASSGFVLVSQLWRWSRSTAVFAERAQLAMVLAMLWPIAVYVAAIYGLGIYVSSALLIAYFMRRHGRYGWALSAGVAVAVPVFFFLIFERWFLVPLPKGPLETMLGF